jgi:hypothetical protein
MQNGELKYNFITTLDGVLFRVYPGNWKPERDDF